MTATRSESRPFRERLIAAAARADAYFVSDALRNAGAADLANTRMGLILCFAVSVGIFLFIPLQLSVWPAKVTLATALVAAASFTIPFSLRQSPAIRATGQIVCGVVALGSAILIWLSAGQAIGILTFLPILPIIGLLVGGARSARLWAGAGLATGILGLGLILGDAVPTSGYTATTPARYAIAIFCVVGIGAVAQIFEAFWNRAAIEVADRAQSELLARDERSRSLLEYATEGVMVVDSHAVVMFASPAAERLVGLEPGQAMGHRLRDFTVPEDFLATRSVWEEILLDPKGVGHLQLRTRPGFGLGDPTEARVLDIAVTNRLANPAVEGVIVRMRDVTELAHAEANYEVLVRHSLQGIAVACEGQFVYANQALADLFGTSVTDILSQSDTQGLAFVHEDEHRRVRALFEQSDPDTTGACELRILRGDGELRWAQMRWSSASWEGRPARQIAYADITAQKELAAQQAEKHERLEAAIVARTRELETSQQSLREQERMAAIGTLAAGIAHQINNPIGSILASADFAILTGNEDDATEIRSEALEDIRAQAVRCGKIVRSVLQFARAEPTEKWANDLSSVLRTALEVTARYANDRDATIEVDLCSEASEPMTLMNPIELEQVFVNLIRNAIESKNSGAIVKVSTRLVGEDIMIVIEDDGPGIPEVHAKHIFDPFYTTRLREGGTGLGLSVARGIVEDHGGSMWLDHPDPGETASSMVARGARFHVRLPTEKVGTRI